MNRTCRHKVVFESLCVDFSFLKSLSSVYISRTASLSLPVRSPYFVKLNFSGKIELIDLQTDMKYFEDTMYVISGKWKIKIILALICGSKRYREIAKTVPDITFRMLSKELKQLELNKLISRTITAENIIIYEITEYAHTLSGVITEMIKWGKDYRENIKT